MSRYFAYIRISTAQQDEENQRFEILKFADSKQFTIMSWCCETVSGAKSYKDRELGKFMELLQAGDVLVTSEISRLGRSLMEVMELLNQLMKKGVKVFTVKERFELGDDLNSKIMAFAFSLAAEIERQMISARTKEALARLKSEGKTLGRPVGSFGKSKLDDKKDLIIDFLSKGVSKASICKIIDCCEGTLSAWLITRDIKIIKNSNKRAIVS